MNERMIFVENHPFFVYSFLIFTDIEHKEQEGDYYATE